MAVGTFILEGGSHHFDQTQAELVSGLRRERKGFFVSLAGQDVTGFYVEGDPDELVQFLEDVIAHAQSELAEVTSALERASAS